MKRPLLRKFWKAIIGDENQVNVAFRPREKEKMKLRRSTKTNYIDSLNKVGQKAKSITIIFFSL